MPSFSVLKVKIKSNLDYHIVPISSILRWVSFHPQLLDKHDVLGPIKWFRKTICSHLLRCDLLDIEVASLSPIDDPLVLDVDVARTGCIERVEDVHPGVLGVGHQ